MQWRQEDTIRPESFKPGQPRPGQTATVIIVSRPKTSAASRRHRSGDPLVILGASARAMAASAARAGWDVYAADLFCDVDLRAVSRTAVAVADTVPPDAPSYPWNLAAAAARFPPDAPWCYTGALENHPDLLDAIARVRPLAGNTGDVVRRLRDPVEVAAAAAASGLGFPETRSSSGCIPLDGTWLVKPLAGAGGRGIRRWTEAVAVDDGIGGVATPRPAARIWQRFVTGTSVSASYCFSQRGSRLLGASRQMIGEPWCHAGPFAWCGAVMLDDAGDPPHGDRLQARLARFGDVLAERFRPVGLVGVDLVVDDEGRLTVIEVNPRPTASMELFERSGAGSIAGSHLSACGHAAPSDAPIERPPARPSSTWAKAVLFAAGPTSVSRPLLDALTRESDPWTQADGGWPALADIPRPGQTIPAGAPVVTIFAVAQTAAEAVSVVRDRVARIDALLST